MKYFFLIYLYSLFRFGFNQNNQSQYEYIDNTYYDYSSINERLIPQNLSYTKPVKPEYILLKDTYNQINIVENSKITLKDYEYSGSIGLGNGVIAIIVFMIIGVFVCIFGVATEYSL